MSEMVIVKASRVATRAHLIIMFVIGLGRHVRTQNPADQWDASKCGDLHRRARDRYATLQAPLDACRIIELELNKTMSLA